MEKEKPENSNKGAEVEITEKENVPDKNNSLFRSLYENVTFRIALSAAALVVYIILSHLLYHVLGTGTLTLALIPTISFAWFFGLRGAAASFVIITVLNLLMVFAQGTNLGMDIDLYYAELIKSSILGILISVFLGYISDTRTKLKKRLIGYGQESVKLKSEVRKRKDLEKGMEKEREELAKEVEEKTGDMNAKISELTEMKTAILNMMEDMDVTNKELVKTQDDLKKSLDELKETDIKKDQFISIAAHELKTPLTSIHGFSQLLQTSKVSKDISARKKYLKIIDTETKRLGRLVGDILDLSRIDLHTIKINFDEVNVKSLMEDIKREMEIPVSNKKLTSKFIIDKKLPVILTDSEKLTQILINIINNSVKYTQKGNITVSALPDKDGVHFIVKDTGIGISRENQEKIFDRFYQVDSTYTRKAGGTGLGLSLCKEFLSLLGGDIWVKSEEGKGSEFHFTLPVKGSMKEQKSESEKKAMEQLKRAGEVMQKVKQISSDVKVTQ